MKNILKSFKTIIYLSIYLSITYSPSVFGDLSPSVLNRTWEMPQIDKQGNAILVLPVEGVGFNVYVFPKRSTSPLKVSIADTSVTANTVWASIMTPGTTVSQGVPLVVWCTPSISSVLYYATISFAGNTYSTTGRRILEEATLDLMNIRAVKLATNIQNKVIATWSMGASADTVVAQYAVYSDGLFGSAASLFQTTDINNSVNPAISMVALDENGNALFAMSYYDNWLLTLQNTLVAKYLSSSGTLGSLMTYSNSNIQPMALTSVQYAGELYCIVSNTLSSVSNVTTSARTQWLNKSLVNQITYADGFVDGNPIFTDIFYITTENLNLNLTFSVQSNKVTQTFLFENSVETASYLGSENLNANLNLVYGSSGAPYFGFLTPGSLIATVFNLETNQVLFNQQIADFTPTNSQISINESGVVVIFYTDASGNVYTYRTTVGSSNPLVDAVKNYSRLKPQKGRF